MLKRKFLKIIFGLVLITSNIPTCFALSAQQIQIGINNIIKKYDPGLDLGIEVRQLSTGATLYQRNNNKLFMPASTLKIFTAVAALSYLGEDYKFQTKLLAKSNVVNHGALNSDIFFYFDGDPTLHRDDLENMIAVLEKSGITNIQGNVIIDDSVFDRESYGPGWMIDEKNFCYAAPTSAITIDRNCFPFQISPGTRVNMPATIIESAEYRFIPITSNIITTRASYEDCPLNLQATNDNNYYISGCVHPSSSTINLLIAVKNMRVYSSQVIAALLTEHHIRLAGKIKFDRLPVNQPMVTLVTHTSEPLQTILKRMLKKSDNLIADAVYKKIGSSYYHKRGTWKNSAKAIAAILVNNTKIDFRKLKIVDGSGLSRFNLITPAQFNAVLRYAYLDQKIREPFMAALPTAGIDGTMRYRLPQLQGRVKAKTGNMASITSLAGYINTASKQTLAFTIIVNDFLAKPHKYHKLQDEICSFLARS